MRFSSKTIPFRSKAQATQRSLACAGRAALTATLVAMLAGQPVVAELPAAAATAKNPIPAAPVGADTASQRALQTLNRFAFGPRPGDLALVEKMGASRWFETQLNPGSIDDSALDTRLQQYPAAAMPIPEEMQRYPSPQMLKQIENGKAPMPSDPQQRTMVTDQLAFYRMKQEQKNKNPQTDAAIQPAATIQTATATQPETQGAGTLLSDGTMAPAGSMQPENTQPDTTAAATQNALAKKRRNRQVQAGMDAVADAGSAADAAQANGMTTGSAMGASSGSANTPANERVSPGEMQQLMSQAPDQRFQSVMAMSPEELVKLRGALGGAQAVRLTQGMTPLERETLTALPGSVRMVALEAMESRLDRDVYSNRQLEAVMTDFWLNHFNVFVGKNQIEPYMLATYERDTIRPHALGRFEDLLVATAESPAMQIYLDNFRSIGPDSQAAERVERMQQRNPNGKLPKQVSAGLNENYGRELMELHTLGVNGGYTQADVTQVSKVFTGWTIDKPYQGGGFTFDERRHEPGSKTVLGQTIQENGMKEGLQVLHMLASSPATANFICGKLAVRFVSDNPPPALVNRMAAAYLKSDGDIKVVLRTMFNSPEFWAPANYRAKVKTPLEFVVSAVRAGDVQVASTQALVQSLVKLGMPLYGMQTPNGYSWKQDEWVSTGALVSRMNFALVLAGDRLPGTRTDWTQLLREAPPSTQGSVVPASYTADASETPLQKEHKLEMILVGQPVSDRTRSTVLAQDDDVNATEQAATQFDLRGEGKRDYAGRGLGRLAKDDRGPDDPQAAVMAGLLLGSPEFQRR